ncbi:MAG: hypothetical protein ACTSR7_18725 [Promethearchaeota archaeon]
MNVNNIKGRTEFDSGKFLGYILWKQSDGFHLRWTTKGSKEHLFQGKITCQTKRRITRRIRSETKNNINEAKNNKIEWDTTLQNNKDGFDFLTPGDFTVELLINKKKVKTKNIFLGPQMTPADSNPFIITQKTSESEFKTDKKKVKIESKIKTGKEFKEPTYEPTPEPTYEPTPEPTYEPTPEPAYEPTPEPTYEPTPEPEYEPTPEPIYEPTPKGDHEPETRITAWLNQLQTYREVKQVNEPTSEPVYEPTPESEPKLEKSEESEEKTSKNESIED